MNSLTAEAFKERSPLYAKHQDASLVALADTAAVARYSEAAENTQLAHCALVDLSNLARVGFRGTDTADFLHSKGYDLPEAANHANAQDDGSLVARLSQTEYLVLGSLRDAGTRVADLEAQWQLSEQANYLLPRQDSHAWLLLTGEHCASVMAKLCGVDLRDGNFTQGAVAQTSAARINVIVINNHATASPSFHILCDRASASYFWDAVLDAMLEFGGKPAGIAALLD